VCEELAGDFVVGSSGWRITVAIVKFGFSFSTNSHEDLSANVLLARYPLAGFWMASSSVMGFQSFSLYTYPGLVGCFGSRMAAKLDVITCKGDQIS